MGTGLYEQLESTWMSFKFFIPEVILIVCYSIATCRRTGEATSQRSFYFSQFLCTCNFTAGHYFFLAPPDANRSF